MKISEFNTRDSTICRWRLLCRPYETIDPNKEDAQWCIDFVVDFMLRAEEV
jgi:hypothetical protein